MHWSLLRHNPTAQIIQGGTDLMVEINFNHRKPTDVIALRRVEELRGFVFNAQRTQITIGAGLPYQQMEHGEIAEVLPALAQAARTVGFTSNSCRRLDWWKLGHLLACWRFASSFECT